MADTLEKLRPDRDLQCYFQMPSAIAAISNASPSAYTVSGTWRQQFDWAVIDWNRDNVFEHPALRYLPDGDLSGLVLSYQETRTNCIPIDSPLYPTVDWPYLRIWADSGGVETLYRVSLMKNATPVAGSYQPAYVDLTLQGAPTANDYVGFAFLDEHYTHQLYYDDTPDKTAQALVDAVNAFSPTMKATLTGTTIRLFYVGAGQTQSNSTTGASGNRVGVYTFVSGAGTQTWNVPWAQFANGTSPATWRITLNFSSLIDINGNTVPTTNIRKMRWTYSADLQSGSFVRSEFQVVISSWTVTGTNRSYQVAGPGSARIEDGAESVQYTGNWNWSRGNFSGSTIHYTSTAGDSLTCTYRAGQTHTLYLGTRITFNSGQITLSVDGHQVLSDNLYVAGEDVLVRRLVGEFSPGAHTVSITYTGPAGSYFYFDFLEVAIPAATLPTFDAEPKITLATDWDTYHSQTLPAERTAWIINSLGFMGRANHYAGALWFYELVATGQQYASGTVTFTGTPDPNMTTEIVIGRTDQPANTASTITHLNLIGDTAETVAKAFEQLLNNGFTAVWAQANGNILTITSRSMGSDGNNVSLVASTTASDLTIQVSSATLSGGADGNSGQPGVVNWRTDLQASPRINRAARDWSMAYFRALKGYGIDVATAFSTELGNGDPSPEVGIAQVYPDGKAVEVTTPALQTNFGPQSLAYWQQVYADMAGLHAAAGLQPYLQFGEIQWWYFPNSAGMPFYDAYTTSSFQAQFGRSLPVFTSNSEDPTAYSQETAFLAGLIGTHTAQIMSFVRAQYPTCRFEVLYPTDVNDTAFNQQINYSTASWTPGNLTCLKTESFGFTGARNLKECLSTIEFPASQNFPAAQSSHLIGIGDSSTPWLKETQMSVGQNLESVVLFALDQYCLIGYATPLPKSMRRSVRMG
ncbi:MAG TPA: hypothetical protein VKV15_25640 [Bryobacteraceae bacterium]|nr:hypothetical protein [Bryobacteraceae bacterium]